MAQAAAGERPRRVNTIRADAKDMAIRLGAELQMEPSPDCLELPGAVDELPVSWAGLRRDRLDECTEPGHSAPAADQDTTPSL